VAQASIKLIKSEHCILKNVKSIFFQITLQNTLLTRKLVKLVLFLVT